MEEIIKDKKKIRIYFSLLVTVICIIGVSYAFFQLFLKQSDNNTLVSRTCFDTSLTENTEKIVLENAYPVVDSEGLKGIPFTFTLKNNCSSYIRLYITIDSEHRGNLGTKYLDDNYIKVNISPKGTTDGQSIVLGSKKLTDLDNNRKGYIIVNTGLQANEEKSFDLRLWMDENVTLDQGLGKSWEGKIVVIGEASDGMPLNEAILADNKVVEPLTVPGSEVSAYTLDDTESETSSVSSAYQAYYVTYGTGWTANGTKFDLTGTAVTNNTYANSYSSLVGKYLTSQNLSDTGSSTAGDMQTTTNLDSVYYVVSATSDSFVYKKLTSNKNTTEAILASAEDDYGTSYYFRGAINNNYVQFANKCWRIVRITGDGSIKLVLHNDNISNVSNPCSASNNSKTAAFARYSENSYKTAFNSSYDDNAYIGFMYGTTGASDYASTHANTNKSTILTNLETWYKNNLSSYESKLADVIWCNDKDSINDMSYDPRSICSNAIIDESGRVALYHAAYKRIVSSGDSNDLQPNLICTNDVSKLTVSDTTNGNGALKYKIGLLTADEVAFAGMSSLNKNFSSYLTENASDGCWWTLSPAYFAYLNMMDHDIIQAQVLEVGDSILDGSSDETISVRLSIALISSVTISGGSGTSEDPYVVN